MAERRFHINPETGRPNICRAKTPEGCSYFGEDHYDSREEAQAAYERSQEDNLLQKPVSRQLPVELNSRGYLREDFAALAAPKGIYCPGCGRATNHREAVLLINSDWANCECGVRYDLGDAKVELPADSESYRFLQSKEEVLKATWYHATSREDWLQEVDPELGHFEVHMGTEAAAFDRGLSEYALHQRQGEDFILYEVELDPTAEVADEIIRDENGAVLRESSSDVVRYINLWEDMASVSLAVKPEKVRIKSSRAVTRDEAHRRISLYNVDPDFEDKSQR